MIVKNAQSKQANDPFEIRSAGGGKNKLPLDFDPRGQLIEVTSTDGLVLSGSFPEAEGADEDDD